MREKILQKIAVSKEGKKIGKITQVTGKKESIILERKEHAVIVIGKGKDKVLINALTENIQKITEEQVWFDITKEAFERKIAKARYEKKAKGIRARQKLDEEQAMNRAINRMKPRI
jgi:hypothetical protein